MLFAAWFVMTTLFHVLATDDDTWPRFRGADGTGVLRERHHPDSWNAETHVAWSAEIPGGGWSSPVVVADRVFLTTAVASDGSRPKGFLGGVADPMSRGGGGRKPTQEVSFRVLCLSLENGERLWETVVGTLVPEYAVHPSNTYATETPATDGERLFVTFGALGEVAALDFDGQVLWRVETGVHRTSNDFGWSISLVAGLGACYLQNDNEESSFLLALEAKTGEERFRVDRGKGTSWGSPLLLEHGGRALLIACGPDSVVAYDAKSGGTIWEAQGIGGSFSASPTTDGVNVVFGNASPGARGPLIAVSLGAEGKVDLRDPEHEHVAWRQERVGPGFPSPVIAEGLVYVLGSPSLLACHDATTGERLWRERLPDAATLVASPWVCGKELFILDEKGTTYVVKVGRTFELSRTNQLDGTYWGTPSVAGSSLLLRSVDRLHCIRD